MLRARGKSSGVAGIRRWIHTREGGSTCRGAQGEREDAVMLMASATGLGQAETRKRREEKRRGRVEGTQKSGLQCSRGSVAE